MQQSDPAGSAVNVLNAAAIRTLLILGLWATALSGHAMARTGQPLAYATTFNGISVYDTGNYARLGTIPCCHSAAVAPDGKLVYAINNSNSSTVITISVIDANSFGVVATIPLEASVAGASTLLGAGLTAISPDGKQIYVAAGICPSGMGLCNKPSLAYFATYVIDAVTHNVGIAVQGKGAVGGIAFSPDGKQTYVTNFEPYYYADPPLSSVLVLGGAGPSIPFPGYSQASGIVITPDGTHAYVADTGSNGLWVIDTAKRAIVAALPVSASNGIAITPDGKHVYVGNSVIETATNTVVATLPVFGSGIAVTPDGEHVYLASTVIETAKNTVAATLPDWGSLWAIIPPPQGVPFAAFSAKLDIHSSSSQHQDAFDLQSSFILSSKVSNGIHPDIEPLKLQVGPFITTIPAGSFKQAQGSSYSYEGVIDGVRVQAKIDLTGTLRYRLRAKVSGANLSGIINPTQVSMSLGGSAGLASVKADPASHDHLANDILN